MNRWQYQHMTEQERLDFDPGDMVKRIKCPQCGWVQDDVGQHRCDRWGCSELFDERGDNE